MTQFKDQVGEIPPPPEKPSEYECCGRGCSPCVFDYYETALRKWQQQYSINDRDRASDE